MKQTRLEIAAENLAKAALEFDEALTATYRQHQDYLFGKEEAPSREAKKYLAGDLKSLLGKINPSLTQSAAINACFSEWKIPKLYPVKRFPTGRSGGAA